MLVVASQPHFPSDCRQGKANCAFTATTLHHWKSANLRVVQSQVSRVGSSGAALNHPTIHLLLAPTYNNIGDAFDGFNLISFLVTHLFFTHTSTRVRTHTIFSPSYHTIPILQQANPVTCFPTTTAALLRCYRLPSAPPSPKNPTPSLQMTAATPIS